jgi:hypothetical protein
MILESSRKNNSIFLTGFFQKYTIKLVQKFTSSKGYVGIVLILGVVFIGGLTMIGGLLPTKKKPPTISPIEKGQLIETASDKAEQGLQLKSLDFVSKDSPTPGPTSINSPTPTLTPGPTINACPHDNRIPISQPSNCICREMLVDCVGGKCVNVRSINGVAMPFPNNCNVPNEWAFTKGRLDEWCGNVYENPPKPNPDGVYCVAKPVIYLYPEKETLVDVSVKTEGKIVVSDPLYPPGGWKNVLAFPSGKLIYQGREYRELFYESEAEDIKAPQSGLIARKE